MANYTKSEILKNIPRYLKTQPGAPKTHLAYITDDEAKMLQKKKPGTPHGTRFGIPSYDFMSETGGWVSSGDAVDVGGSQPSTNTQPNLGSGLPGGSNITGTTSGTPNPHTDTGFSGGPTLASGAPNPGFTPPPPVDTSGGDGGGTGGGGTGGGGTDTGSGSSGGSGSGFPGGFRTTDLVDLHNRITGGNVLEGGIGNLRELSRDTLSLSDQNMMKNLMNQDTQNVGALGEIKTNTIPSDDYTIMKPTITAPTTEPTIKDPTIIDKIDDWTSIDIGGGTASVEGSLTNPRIQYEREMLGGTGKFDLDSQGNLGALMSWPLGNAKGGPVGLMSLPQGYENGGEVLEESETVEEESTPFGGTRERVIDQVEAFDNAPMHIEEPMVGMYGEKIPLTTARRVQGYMEGLDPVKRNLIEEMMQMFRMKKMQEKMQDQQQEGLYFGPQPKEYSI